MPSAKPVTIGKETFKSLREAARAKGVSVQAISNAVKNNTLEVVGIGNRIRVKYKGQVYNSYAEAARANGISRQALWARFTRQLGDF